MADKPVVHIGENSPEQVAFKLLIEVAACEGKHMQCGAYTDEAPTREWLLDAYAECLQTVTNPYGRLSEAKKR